MSYLEVSYDNCLTNYTDFCFSLRTTQSPKVNEVHKTEVWDVVSTGYKVLVLTLAEGRCRSNGVSTPDLLFYEDLPS